MNKLYYLVVVLFCSCLTKHESDAKKAEVTDAITASHKISGDTLNINNSRSLIYWKGTKMRGRGMHSGEISFKKAYFLMENDKIIGGEFVVDMNTIKVTDIPPTDPIPIKNLTDHLKNSDFFNVKQYPVSHFQIIEVKKLTGDSLEISGNLTIKDITRNIKITAVQKAKAFTSTFIIDRYSWNVAYEGNWADRTLVDKEMELTVDLAWD